jgi:ribosomal protein L21E
MVGTTNPKYKLGQQVIITRPGDSPSISMRDCTLEPYLGHTGRVTKCYWIGPRTGEVFFVYVVSVKINGKEKEIILHEDEIETTFAKIE